MDETIIKNMVKPYLVNGQITYDDFENLFDMLSLKEQYGVLDVLYKNGIELVEGNRREESEDENFEILYEDDIFYDEYEESEKEYICNGRKDVQTILKVKDNVKMSNESLIKLIQEGDMQAKQDLCIKNRGLVDKCVNKYIKLSGNKLDFEDLEQVGMIGMLKAAERYDFSMGTVFSTYAVSWIKQAIRREIDDSGFTIRIPVHKMDIIFKVCKVISKYLDVEDSFERIQKAAEELHYPAEVIEDCLRLYDQFLRTASLDVPVGEDSDTPLNEFIFSKEEVLPEDIVSGHICTEMLRNVLETLKEREKDVIKLRYGFDDGRRWTLEEIGCKYGVTRERIRQIEQIALRKMRHPSRSRKLRDFWED